MWLVRADRIGRQDVGDRIGGFLGDGAGGARHGQSCWANFYLKVVTADVNHVFVLQDRMLDSQAVDPNTVEAVEIKDLPLA